MAVISVIVPVYNAETYLRECIASILDQSHTDLELILVDDGSTDSSAQICAEAAGRDSRVKVLSTPNAGVSVARNLGTTKARGQYVCYVDADDRLISGALEAMLSLMESTADCDIVCGTFTHSSRYKGITSDGVLTHTVLKPVDAIINNLYQRGSDHPSAWGKLYRREVLGDAPFAAGRRYEDLEAFPAIYLRARRIAITPTPLYYYRPNPGSFINTWTPARLDALWAVDSIRSFVAGNCPEASPAALARSFSAYCNIFILALQHGEDEAISRCLRFIREHRRAMLSDRRVRLKNKLAALASFFVKESEQ